MLMQSYKRRWSLSIFVFLPPPTTGALLSVAFITGKEFCQLYISFFDRVSYYGNGSFLSTFFLSFVYITYVSTTTFIYHVSTIVLLDIASQPIVPAFHRYLLHQFTFLRYAFQSIFNRK